MLAPRFQAGFLVFWHRWIDLLAPGPDSADEIRDFSVAVLLKEFSHALAASTHGALDHNFAIAVDLIQPSGHVVHGDKRAADVGDLVFEWLADVENEEAVAGVEALLEFLHAHLGDTVFHRRLRTPRRNAAELLVVDEMRDSGMLAADRAIGIFAQLQLTEAHGERVDKKQAADEGLAAAED